VRFAVDVYADWVDSRPDGVRAGNSFRLGEGHARAHRRGVPDLVDLPECFCQTASTWSRAVAPNVSTAGVGMSISCDNSHRSILGLVANADGAMA
jgi:hypothetical protein